MKGKIQVCIGKIIDGAITGIKKSVKNGDTISDKDVYDPWYTRNFETCYQEIYNGCLKLKEHITNK